MLPALPPLSQLRAFEAAERLKSFTRAAEELGTTQSAVSHHVGSLELVAGTALFARRGRGVVPTAEGARLAGAVRDGLGRVAATLTQLRRAGDARRVVVSAMPGFAVKWLFPRLIRFDEHHPGIDVDVAVSVQAIDFTTSEVDLAIRYGQSGTAGLHVEKLIGEVMAPVCSPRLRRGLRPLRCVADLTRHVVLHDEVREVDGQEPTWRRWLAAAGADGVAMPHSRRFGQSNMVVDAAVDGLGVALGRSPLVAADLAAGRLVVPFGPPLDLGLGYYIVCPHQALTRSSVRSFVAWLRREAGFEPDGAALIRSALPPQPSS